MKVIKVRDINKSDDSINVMVDVDFENDLASRWELTDPIVSVVYNLNDETKSNYMELLDRGMNVHGFELSQENQEQISRFLTENNIFN